MACNFYPAIPSIPLPPCPVTPSPRPPLVKPEFSKNIVTSIVNANVALSSSDSVDKIILNWATKSDTGRDIMTKVKNVETIKW